MLSVHLMLNLIGKSIALQNCFFFYYFFYLHNGRKIWYFYLTIRVNHSSSQPICWDKKFIAGIEIVWDSYFLIRSISSYLNASNSTIWKKKEIKSQSKSTAMYPRGQWFGYRENHCSSKTAFTAQTSTVWLVWNLPPLSSQGPVTTHILGGYPGNFTFWLHFKAGSNLCAPFSYSKVEV